MNQHPNLLSIFGRDGIEDSVIEQMNTCLEAGVGRGDETLGVLCADAHQGYSCPIGGVVAYDKHVSPNLVGFDIGCGNHAIKLDVDAGDVDVPKVMDAIWERIPFGMTREQIAFDASPYGRDVLQRIKDSELKVVRSLYDKAYSQLGSVGGGNHFVNLMRGESDGKLWIANHFGSRGFGPRSLRISSKRSGQRTASFPRRLSSTLILAPVGTISRRWTLPVSTRG